MSEFDFTTNEKYPNVLIDIYRFVGVIYEDKYCICRCYKKEDDLWTFIYYDELEQILTKINDDKLSNNLIK